MKKAICLLLLLILSGCGAALAADLPEEELPPVLTGLYDVVRVVDGDTIIVDIVIQRSY